MSEPIVSIEGLKTHFFLDEGTVRAVEGVDLVIPRGTTVGLVGESGCGKSVTALSILRLISPPGRIVAGKITLHRDGERLVLTDLPDEGKEIRQIRGKEISMIFQEPMTSLSPVHTIGNQIVEAVTLHTPLRGKGAWAHAVEMLGKVGIPDPARRARQYPHELSGGMRQRAMIAMALACRPSLLIADEPTTALDVTIQAQILDLMRDLQSELDMAILLITHDLGVVAEMASEVAVMYCGRIVDSCARSPAGGPSGRAACGSSGALCPSRFSRCLVARFIRGVNVRSRGCVAGARRRRCARPDPATTSRATGSRKFTTETQRTQREHGGRGKMPGRGKEGDDYPERELTQAIIGALIEVGSPGVGLPEVLLP